MKNQLLLDNGICKWYLHDEINKYINSCQAENLPILNNLICCNVVGVELDDLVLIDNKQNIIHCQYNTFDGMEQMYGKINILKISKYYEQFDV